MLTNTYGFDHPPLLSLRPSWPNLFRPQPNTAPERVRAKLWAPPADIWAKGIPCRDWMIWGVEMLCPFIPSPSCPYRFWPQEKTWPPMKRKRQNTQCLVLWGKHNTLNGRCALCCYKPSSPLESAWECQCPQATWAICTSDKLLMFLFYREKEMTVIVYQNLIQRE